jgi:hypothetical protein
VAVKKGDVDLNDDTLHAILKPVYCLNSFLRGSIDCCATGLNVGLLELVELTFSENKN